MIKPTILISALLISSLSFGQVERNLKAYYSFDSATLEDEIGNLDLTSTSPKYSEDRFGSSDKSITFSPTSNKQAYIEDSIMDLKNDFSLSFWFKLDAPISQSGYNLISSRKSRANGEMGAVEFLVWRDSLIKCNIRNFFTELSELASTTKVVKDSWYHVVLVRKGDSSYLHINNKLEHKLPLITALNVSPAVLWSFGSDGGNTSRVLSGNIDDARFYNDDLTNKEIDTLYTYPLNTSSLEKLSSSKLHQINIFPNPSSEYITLEVTKSIENIVIYDLVGKQVSIGKIDENLRVDIQDLKTGKYILVIKFTDGVTHATQIIKTNF